MATVASGAMTAVPAVLVTARASRAERATTTCESVRPSILSGRGSASGAGFGRKASSMAAMYSTGVARPR